MTETDTSNPITRFLNNLEERAGNISDTRLVSIVLAFVAGGLFVSVVAAVLHAIGEGAARWEWLPGAKALFEWLDGFAQNFSTEMIGAVITFVLLEVLLARRREKEAEEREKARLILQMGSPIHDAAIEAARQLREQGWLQDGSLRQASLVGANLQGAQLWSANLQEANLGFAKLQDAMLTLTDLRGVALWDANLQRVWMLKVDLRGAKIGDAELHQAELFNVDLRGAIRMTCAQLQQAETLQGTTLPDGTQLPHNDTWRDEFDNWCQTVTVDDEGCIIPAPLDDEPE